MSSKNNNELWLELKPEVTLLPSSLVCSYTVSRGAVVVGESSIFLLGLFLITLDFLYIVCSLDK